MREYEWTCAGCGVPSPNKIRSCDCPTSVVLCGPIEHRKQAWKHDPQHAVLAETIRMRLLGVKPEDQDVVLEDSDWRMILIALGDSPALPSTDGKARL